MEYNIEFKNNCDTILGTVTGIRNNVSFYCTDEYATSSSVTMWAIRKGVIGTKSKVVALFPTSKTIITETRGMYIVFGLLLCFPLFIKNQP